MATPINQLSTTGLVLTPADLRYDLVAVTPTLAGAAWTIALPADVGLLEDCRYEVSYSSGTWSLVLVDGGSSTVVDTVSGAEDATELAFEVGAGDSFTVTATRSWVAALRDRAVNRVTLGSAVSSVTFVLPATTPGKARDLLLRLVVTGSEVPSIGFAEQGGGVPSFDVADDEWANIEQGVNILSFTETQEEEAAQA